MSSFFFYLFATVMILAALAVVLARNPLYNVLSLVVAIFALSSLFMMMEAYFVGVILLLVYAGAVLVFFLFVVMFLNLKDAPAQQSRFQILGSLAGAAMLFGFSLAFQSFLKAQSTDVPTVRGTIETVGKILFTEYLLPFELTSLLLLIAILGIVSLAKGALRTGKEIEATQARNT